MQADPSLNCSCCTLPMAKTIIIFTLVCIVSGQMRSPRKIYDVCINSTEIVKCLKIEAIKVGEKALKTKKLDLFNGVSIIDEGGNRTGRFFKELQNLNRLDDGSVNKLLYSIVGNFLQSRSIHISIPKIVEEARKRKKDKFTGPFLAALAIKGTIMSVAYKSIAAMAGTALIIGKMALVIAAILGLKKLVSGGKEKTTVEIVKHPKHSTSHSYSSSYEEGEGHYHRSMSSAEDMMMLERITRNLY